MNETSGGPPTPPPTPKPSVVDWLKRLPLWVKIAAPIVGLIVVGAIAGNGGGGSSSTAQKINALARHETPTLVTLATTTTTLAPTTTLPPTTTAPPTTRPATTAAPATAPPTQATSPPTQAPGPRIVTAGSFCAQSEVGQMAQTSAGTPMVCATTAKDGTPYTQPRWRSP